jgi:hypothetical protein
MIPNGDGCCAKGMGGYKALAGPRWDRIQRMLMVPKCGGPVPEGAVGTKGSRIPRSTGFGSPSTRMWGELGPTKVAGKERSRIPRADGFFAPSAQKWGELYPTKG